MTFSLTELKEPQHSQLEKEITLDWLMSMGDMIVQTKKSCDSEYFAKFIE